MHKKTLLLTILILIIAQTTNALNHSIYYAFENNAQDSAGSTDLYDFGSGITYSTTNKKFGNYAVVFNGTGHLNRTFAPYGTSAGHINRSISLWVNLTPLTSGQYTTWVVIGNTDTTADSFSIAHFNASGTTSTIQVSGGATGNLQATNHNLLTNQWNHIVGLYNQNRSLQLYVNNVYIGSATQSADADVSFTNGGVSVGGLEDSTSNRARAYTYIDQVKIFDYQLSRDDITELYNENDTSTGPITSPSWVSPTPDSGTTNNTQVTLNASCDAGLNYNIYFGDTNPPTSLVVNNKTTGNYTTNVAVEGTYYYLAACYNETSGTSSLNTSVRTWNYDATFPVITLNDDNEFNQTNATNANAYDKSVKISFNATDNIALYAYVVNITKNGTVYFNITNTTMSGTTATISHTLNANTWPPGTYNAQIIVADAHTNTQIPDYQVNPSKSKITFKTQTGNNIKIETDDSSDITATKLTDRYTFTMSFDDGLTKTRVYHVKTDQCKLAKPAGTTYKGHLVSYCNGDGNWIDFEGVGGTVTTNKIDDYHYTITITDNPPIATFNSIGGLNTYNATYTFYVGNYTYNNPTIIVGSTQTLQLNLTKDTGWTTSATLNYNNSVITVTDNDPYFSSSSITQQTSGTIPFTWNATINTGTKNYTFNISNTQTVIPVLLNFTFYNQETLTLANLTVFLELINDYYSSNVSGANGVVRVNITDLTSPDLDLRYWASGYTTRIGYLLLNSTAASWNINLYLINVSGYQNVTIYVIDDFANPLEGLVVRALKYDITTNTYILQESGITNTAGSVIMTLTKFDEYYKFMVERAGSLLKITSPSYITTDSVTIQIITSESIGEEFFNYLSISGDLTFNTATDNFRLDYSDTSGLASNVCLSVYRGANSTKYLYDSQCSSSSSGTILISVSAENGTSYYAVATYVDEGVSKFLDSLSYTYPSSSVFGSQGLFLQLLLTLAFAFTALFSTVIAAVVIPFSLIIGSVVGLNAFSAGMLATVQVIGLVVAIVLSMRKG